MSKFFFEFFENSVLYFRISLGGNEEIELTWLRNNKEIPENPDFRREHDGNSFKLLVSEV